MAKVPVINTSLRTVTYSSPRASFSGWSTVWDEFATRVQRSCFISPRTAGGEVQAISSRQAGGDL
jgi:hypothetical protein